MTVKSFLLQFLDAGLFHSIIWINTIFGSLASAFLSAVRIPVISVLNSPPQIQVVQSVQDSWPGHFCR